MEGRGREHHGGARKRNRNVLMRTASTAKGRTRTWGGEGLGPKDKGVGGGDQLRRLKREGTTHIFVSFPRLNLRKGKIKTARIRSVKNDGSVAAKQTVQADFGLGKEPSNYPNGGPGTQENQRAKKGG